MEDNKTDLFYNWHRFYRPELGQYITPDPIGLAGGINMYSYVGGNPINYIDPYGLDRWRVSAFYWGGFSAEWGDDNGISYFDITIGLGFGAGISYDPTASMPDHLRPNTDCGESGKTYLGLKGIVSGSVTAGPIRGATGVKGRYGFMESTHYSDPMKNSTTLERNAIDNKIEPFADGSISKPFWGLGFNISAYVGFNGGNSWK